MPPATPPRAGVLGSPIAHSLSPALHRAAYAALGLDWRYDAVEVAEAGLAGFLAGLGPEWMGLSLTMPLKRAVLPLLDSATPLVEQVGAANTVVLREGGRHGDNTDVPGLLAALAEAGVVAARHALVLGGGATATSALAALRQLGVTSPVVLARDPARCAPLRAAAQRLGVHVQVLPWPDRLEPAGTDLVVATTPAGATAALAATLPGGPLPLLFDVAYHPWPTPLAAAWLGRGGAVLGGLDLLVHQAVGQVRLMTGQDPPVEVLRAAALHALRGG